MAAGRAARRAVFELADAGGQAGGAFLGGEQVCLQGGAADGGPGAGHAGWLGFGGVDLIDHGPALGTLRRVFPGP
jgi:hypothetical protein